MTRRAAQTTQTTGTSENPRSGNVLFNLQRTAGNQAVGRALDGRKTGDRSIQPPGPSTGQALNSGVQRMFERQFDRNFDDVRIHTDDDAAELARTTEAKAFTVGSDVIFGKNEYSPSTMPGKRLLAHELTHIVQQSPDADGSPQSDDRLEAEARTAARAVTTGTDIPSEFSAAPRGSLQRTPENGNRSVKDETDTDADVHTSRVEASSPASVNEAMNRAMTAVDEANVARATVENVLLPAFQQAVDAVDPVAALELATAIVRGVRLHRENLTGAQYLSTAYDPSRFVSSYATDGPTGPANAARGSRPTSPSAPTPGSVPPKGVTGPVDLDYQLHAILVTELNTALDAFEPFERMAVVGASPQEFRGSLVAGSRYLPMYDDAVKAVTREAATTVDLLWTVVGVRELVDEGSQESLRRAVDLVEAWKSRPINFHFLVRALSPYGLVVRLAGVEGSSGHTLEEIAGAAREQGRTFGVTTDVGTYKASKAVSLLSYAWNDWAVSDEDALGVFEMWASASKPAKLTILQQLDERGLLLRLCENLPGLAVRAMHDAIQVGGPDAPAVQSKLNRYLAEQSEGQTASELYEERIMENIEEGDLASGYLWTLLDVSHSALTFGFKDIHDQAYVAMREGEISSDEYLSITTKAAGRSAALLGVAALTGGTAGGFAEGLALGRGASATTASLIGGGTGGAVSGLATQFSADLYDQALLGKEGFSDPSDYGVAAGLGAGSGLLLGGVGIAGARYFPRSAERAFDYHSGSEAGAYHFATAARQALHARLYELYRGSVHTGRRVGRGTLPREDLAKWADLSGSEGRAHTLKGETESRGGHMWPPNRAGGPGRGPKSSYPRTMGEDEIMHVLADIMTDPQQVWTQQTGPGTGTQVTGYPTNPPTTNAGNPVRYVGTAVRNGVQIHVVVEPGGKGLVTGYPIGTQDPASLVPFVRPGISEVSNE